MNEKSQVRIDEVVGMIQSIIPKEDQEAYKQILLEEVLKNTANIKQKATPKEKLQGVSDSYALFYKGKVFTTPIDPDVDEIAQSLEDAQTHAKNGGLVASMPHLINSKSILRVEDNSIDNREYVQSNPLWRGGSAVSISEEHVGIDKKGILVNKGEPVVIVVHGGGLLTAKTIRDEFSIRRRVCEGNGKNKYSSAYSYKHNLFEDLTQGKVNDKDIKLYSYEDIIQGKNKDPYGNYGIWLNCYNAAESYEQLLTARIGGLDYYEAFLKTDKFNRTTCKRRPRLQVPYKSERFLRRLGRFKKPKGFFLELSNDHDEIMCSIGDSVELSHYEHLKSGDYSKFIAIDKDGRENTFQTPEQFRSLLGEVHLL